MFVRGLINIEAATNIGLSFATVWADVTNVVAIAARSGFDPFSKGKTLLKRCSGFVDGILIGVVIGRLIGGCGGYDVEYRCRPGAFVAGTEPFYAGLEIEVGVLKITEKTGHLGVECHRADHCFGEGAVEGDAQGGAHLMEWFGGRMFKTFEESAEKVGGKVVGPERFRNFLDADASEGHILARVVANVKTFDEAEKMTLSFFALCYHAVADEAKE